MSRTAIPRPMKDLVLARDGDRCMIAGPACTGRATCADHRANRGSGGSRVLNNPAALIAACVACNCFWKENTSGWEREELVRRGIRVTPHATHEKTLQRCIETPVQDHVGRWWLLAEDGTREEFISFSAREGT